MILTKTAERISFSGFILVLIFHSAVSFIIFLSLGNCELTESGLSKAIASIPVLWLLSIITLSNAFKFVNAQNKQVFDSLVSSKFYYLIVAMTFLLFPTYTLYIYLLCNQKRTTLWNTEFLFLYKLLGMLPVINFIVMYKLVKDDLEVVNVLRLYFSLSLARYIYLNYKTATDIFE